jgi:hypothetical protein
MNSEALSLVKEKEFDFGDHCSSSNRDFYPSFRFALVKNLIMMRECVNDKNGERDLSVLKSPRSRRSRP